MSNQQDDQLFKGMDEQERLYAPEQVPGAVVSDVELDQGGTAPASTANTDAESFDATAAGPVASPGSGLTGGMSTPNVGQDDAGTPSGDPGTQAGYPLDSEHRG